VIALKNETDVLFLERRALFGCECVHRLTHEKVLAGPRRVVHAENVKQRRFACAGRAHD
jgi:hypothetical protein